MLPGGCIGQICLELGSLTVSRAKESPSEESSAISLRLHDVSANWILLEASSLRHPPRLLLGRLSVKKASGKKGRKDTGKKRDASPSVQIDYVGSICLGGSSEPQVRAAQESFHTRLRVYVHPYSSSLSGQKVSAYSGARARAQGCSVCPAKRSPHHCTGRQTRPQ